MAAEATALAAPAADRAARGAERVLRALGDVRLGVALLLLVGMANLGAALIPDGASILASAPYAALLGAVALTSVAAAGVRMPATWREWRRPGPVVRGAGALELRLDAVEPATLEAGLRDAGYRTRLDAGRARDRWAIHAVRRGWSRFAGQLSHLALVAIVIGAAVGAAFGSEAVASLFPGDQALLDAPRPGFTSGVRLDGFSAEFGSDGRPRVLDTTVTFLRDGEPVEQRVLRVNEPGSFDGYAVHPWTYGPAARIRVATLGGSALLDAPVPLDAERDGIPVGSTELPTAGVTLGLSLADAAANEIGVSLVGAGGLIDSARLRPGEEARVGDLVVSLTGLDAWVTLMSRRDPGLPILFAGAGLLVVSLAVAFWLPRRRLTVRPHRAGGLQLTLRGERLDRPSDELDRLRRLLPGVRSP
ncbi:MAG TPA: cytochrome c biogenesis protein ResB [Candidatus Limnocylindria bacterium]|nr:cytochrome c biogenesis protein ResB [Candidatus Limnocylindria bacterium]